MRALFRVSGLRKAYGGLTVAGGLIGPNGTDKTSVVNPVSGNVRSDAGRSS